jgi:hypothetical protein
MEAPRLRQGFTPLTHSGVVDIAAERKGTLKQVFLFRCGFEFVALVKALPFHI